MNIPDSIKVGGHTIKIEVLDGGTRFSKAGDYCSWDNVIRINTDGNVESCQAEALMHEILEALNSQNDYKLDHSILTSLSEQLFAVIRNNKLDFTKGE